MTQKFSVLRGVVPSAGRHPVRDDREPGRAQDVVGGFRCRACGAARPRPLRRAGRNRGGPRDRLAHCRVPLAPGPLQAGSCSATPRAAGDRRAHARPRWRSSTPAQGAAEQRRALVLSPCDLGVAPVMPRPGAGRHRQAAWPGAGRCSCPTLRRDQSAAHGRAGARRRTGGGGPCLSWAMSCAKPPIKNAEAGAARCSGRDRRRGDQRQQRTGGRHGGPAWPWPGPSQGDLSGVAGAGSGPGGRPAVRSRPPPTPPCGRRVSTPVPVPSATSPSAVPSPRASSLQPVPTKSHIRGLRVASP